MVMFDSIVIFLLPTESINEFMELKYWVYLGVRT